MKILHLNHSDINGGAARAAYRIHHALRDADIDSTMLVNTAAAGDWTVQGPPSKLDKLVAMVRPRLVSPLTKTLVTKNPILHSPAVLPSSWVDRVNESDANVVHLHWIQHEMLSIADIGRIKKPIVWTLHDMWAFCGAEHYTDDFRWREGYHSNNRPAHESGFDLNRWTWKRKLKHWRHPIYIVGDSNWITRCASESVLMRDWPAQFIYYPLDLEEWQPIEQQLARKLLGFPVDVPLLTFGAMGGGRDPRKGFDLLLTAIENLRGEIPEMEVVVFGQRSPRQQPNLGFPVHYTGHLQDNLSLRALYSASTAVVVPSRQEAFGQTASEAHACGTPVIAFNVGGLPDIVEHKRTGYLATPFDTHDLATGIKWVVSNSIAKQLGIQARQKAENNFNPREIANRYSIIYKEILSTKQPPNTCRATSN